MKTLLAASALITGILILSLSSSCTPCAQWGTRNVT